MIYVVAWLTRLHCKRINFRAVFSFFYETVKRLSMSEAFLEFSSDSTYWDAIIFGFDDVAGLAARKPPGFKHSWWL